MPKDLDKSDDEFTEYVQFRQDNHTLELIIEDNRWQAYLNQSKLKVISEAAHLALAQKLYQSEAAAAPKSPHPLVVVMLSNDERIQALNKSYRSKDEPTNVLSFPTLSLEDDEWCEDDRNDDKQGQHLGDVIIALETVLKESKSEKKHINDHICHLIIHGVLHLLGYDHENDEDAKIMEKLETELMNELGLRNPYASI